MQRPDNLVFHPFDKDSPRIVLSSVLNSTIQGMLIKARPTNCETLHAALGSAGQVMCLYAYCMEPYALVEYPDGRQELQAIDYVYFEPQYSRRSVHLGGYVIRWVGGESDEFMALVDLVVEGIVARLAREIARRELYATLNSLSHGTRTSLTTVIDHVAEHGDERIAKECLQLTATLVDFIEFHKQSIDPRKTLVPCGAEDFRRAWHEANAAIIVDCQGFPADATILVALDIYKRAAWNVIAVAYETHGPDLACEVSIELISSGEDQQTNFGSRNLLANFEIETRCSFSRKISIDLSELYGDKAMRLATPLGIHLAARLLSSVGGAIRLPSERDVAVLSMVIPAAPSNVGIDIRERQNAISTISVPQNIQKSISKETTRRIVVLIAEDNLAIQLAMKRSVEGFADVKCVSDGSAAIAALASSRFDACLIDIRMPGADGYQVACFARQREPRPILIACTAQLVAVRDSDLFDYSVQKPVKKEEIRRIFERAGLIPRLE